MQRCMFYAGERIPLLCGMMALRQIEDEIGSIRKAIESMGDWKNHSAQSASFRILARAMAENWAHANHTTLTEAQRKALNEWDSLLSMAADPQMYMANRAMIRAALGDGFRTRYVLPDERKDKYLAAARKKRAAKNKKKSDISVDEMFSMALIAGISITESMDLRPGFVSDCYRRKIEYDSNSSSLGGLGALGALIGGSKKRR